MRLGGSPARGPPEPLLSWLANRRLVHFLGPCPGAYFRSTEVSPLSLALHWTLFRSAWPRLPSCPLFPSICLRWFFRQAFLSLPNRGLARTPAGMKLRDRAFLRSSRMRQTAVAALYPDKVMPHLAQAGAGASNETHSPECGWTKLSFQACRHIGTESTVRVAVGSISVDKLTLPYTGSPTIG